MPDPQRPTPANPDPQRSPAHQPDQPPPPADHHADDACPICGTAAMYGVHCKRICPNCGYKEDCSDLFPA